MDLIALGQEIADTARSVEPKLRAFPTLRNVSSWPALIVAPGEPFARYHAVMDGIAAAEWSLHIILLVSKTNELAATQRLYDWLDPASELFRAIDAIHGLSIVDVTDIGDYDVGTGTAYGATWRVEVDG